MLGAFVTIVAFSICFVAWKVLGEVNEVFHKVSQLQESAAAVHLDIHYKNAKKDTNDVHAMPVNITIPVASSYPLQVHSPRRRLPSSHSQTSLSSQSPTKEAYAFSVDGLKKIV